jgi:hypothetical protein
MVAKIEDIPGMLWDPESNLAKRRISRDKIVGKLRVNSSRKPFYIQVILWKAHPDMLAHLGENDPQLQAVTQLDAFMENPLTGEVSPLSQKIAEIHFAADAWNVNVVAHEVFHAIVHRMRLMYPAAHLLPHEEYAAAEEEIAYELGNWVERIHTWLWSVDPGPPPHNPAYRLSPRDSAQGHFISNPTLPEWVRRDPTELDDQAETGSRQLPLGLSNHSSEESES